MVRKARITGFLALPCFSTFSSPKGRSPTPEKTQRNAYTSRIIHFPENLLPVPSTVSRKYSAFPCPALKIVVKENPQAEKSSEISNLPLLCIPRCVPRLHAATASRDSHFPEIPLIRLCGITFARRSARKAALKITYKRKNSPINRTVIFPVILESSP